MLSTGASRLRLRSLLAFFSCFSFLSFLAFFFVLILVASTSSSAAVQFFPFASFSFNAAWRHHAHPAPTPLHTSRATQSRLAHHTWLHTPAHTCTHVRMHTLNIRSYTCALTCTWGYSTPWRIRALCFFFPRHGSSIRTLRHGPCIGTSTRTSTRTSASKHMHTRQHRHTHKRQHRHQHEQRPKKIRRNALAGESDSEGHMHVRTSAASIRASLALIVIPCRPPLCAVRPPHA